MRFTAGPTGMACSMTNHDEGREKLKELVRDAKLCMFTTMTAEGRHHSRPMAVQDVEFDGDLWFFAFEDSDKVRDVRTHPQVNVAFSEKTSWVSIAGAAEVVHDRARAEELWHPSLKAWFPDGLDTPGLTLIKVHAETAEYWDTPHGKVVTLIQYAASAVRGKNPDVGESRPVNLEG